MLPRPLDRSARERRTARWRVVAAATTLGVLAVTAACESDPSSSGSSAAGSASATPEPTTGVTTAPTTNGTPGDATTGPSEVTDPTEPTTVDPAPTVTEIVTGGTVVSLPGTTRSRAATIRTIDFGELTYPTSVCADVIDEPPRGGFQLRDGEVHADVDGAAGPYSVALRPPRSFGDVNHDGHDDAALVLECSRGGQPVPMGWIYTLDDAGPRPLAGVTLDPDTLPITGVLDSSLADVRITGTNVRTAWDVYLDGDARCCPTATAVVVWTWTDGGLTPGVPTLTRTDPGG